MGPRTLVKNIVNSALDPIGLEIRGKESWTETTKPASSMAPPIAPEPVLPPKTAEVDGDAAAAEPKFTDTDWEYHAPRLSPFRNKHQGERCFIIGNGPSLNRMDLAPLRNEVTLGLNRIYLLYEKLGFPTTYLTSINDLVIQQCAEEIQALPTTKFIKWANRDWRGADWMRYGEDLFFIDIGGPRVGFAWDPVREQLWAGSTVTYVAMQLAYYMGFKKVILIGVDHRFTTQGPAHKEIVSDGDDPNHFDPNYFGKGFTWQLPDLETSETAFRIAKWCFEKAGREIVDATVDGALEVFDKVDYTQVLVENQ